MLHNSVRSFILAACLVATTVDAAKKAGTMRIVGHTGVSAQMMFLGSTNKVYILDKAENNDVRVSGHPAYAVEYNIDTNDFRAMDVRSNPFCAGGSTLGDGRWLATGGNKAVQAGGADAKAGSMPYGSYNGGKALRFLDPNPSSGRPQWNDRASRQMDIERWYPTVEPLYDGSVAILGGMTNGGFVCSKGSNQPSFEYYPPKNGGQSKNVPMLARTVPLSLFPITYLMSSGELFMQANREAVLFSMSKGSETRLPNIPQVPRVYPASGGSALLPLTPASNYTETILFCGGMSLGNAGAWGNEGGPSVPLSNRPASKSCEQISPLADNPNWQTVDSLDEGRSMGQFIQLPTGELWFGNGVKKGVAGYSNDPNNVGRPIGESFGDEPSYQPMYYNPMAKLGNRWRKAPEASVGRLYHSSATLLPDGSILVAGSNPNADVSSRHWGTYYSAERVYPDYYDAERPATKGVPSSFSYGGDGFELTFKTADQASNAKVVLIRTGFSTHAMNMGQRMIELDSVTNGNKLSVAQLPPNPNLFAPGPALAFVVVDGIPSQGKFVMVGSGKIEKQKTYKKSSLPKSTFRKAQTDDEEDCDGEKDTTGPQDSTDDDGSCEANKRDLNDEAFVEEMFPRAQLESVHHGLEHHRRHHHINERFL